MVGACTLPGFSGAVLEKEVKGRRSAWDCAADREARKPNIQCRRHSLVAITGFPEFIPNQILFFLFHKSAVPNKCPNYYLFLILVIRCYGVVC